MPAKSKPANGAASLEVVKISDVLTDPANARRHGERNQQTIRASLTRFGAGRSIVLDGKNVVRAGNGTVEQAASAGIDEVLIVEPKPNQIVAVRRPDWSPSEATAYAIADNRAAELAGWDELALVEQLRSLQGEDFNLESVGYEASEVDAMLERLSDDPAGDPVPPPDDAPLSGQFGVIVMCPDEVEQKAVYERLTSEGLSCRVVCV